MALRENAAKLDPIGQFLVSLPLPDGERSSSLNFGAEFQRVDRRRWEKARRIRERKTEGGERTRQLEGGMLAIVGLTAR
jgi:hypothetical protein